MTTERRQQQSDEVLARALLELVTCASFRADIQLDPNNDWIVEL